MHGLDAFLFKDGPWAVDLSGQTKNGYKVV